MSAEAVSMPSHVHPATDYTFHAAAAAAETAAAAAAAAAARTSAHSSSSSSTDDDEGAIRSERQRPMNTPMTSVATSKGRARGSGARQLLSLRVLWFAALAQCRKRHCQVLVTAVIYKMAKA